MQHRGAASSPSPLDAAAAKQLREALGLTPGDVAHGMAAAYGVQVSPRTVAAWELGAGGPDETQLVALAGALWCSPADLLRSPGTLREYRIARGLAMSDVARAIGMTPAAYELAESTGEWTGDDRQATDLARALRLPLDALLSLTGKDEKLGSLLRSAVTARWQPYVRPVAELVPLPRADVESALRTLHGTYHSWTAGSLNWAADNTSASTGSAGREFLDTVLDRFWSQVGTLHDEDG